MPFKRMSKVQYEIGPSLYTVEVQQLYNEVKIDRYCRKFTHELSLSLESKGCYKQDILYFKHKMDGLGYVMLTQKKNMCMCVWGGGEIKNALLHSFHGNRIVSVDVGV